jgi:UDP-GlcNAc3NAcA epimerase
MKKIISIIGARPQFIKHAGLSKQLSKFFNSLTIHTGQHFDSKMSDVFFKELGIAQPDFLLSGLDKISNHGDQTALMLVEIEKIIMNEKPDAVLVYGDTNSTLSGSLAASKLNIPIIHIEAGLRSFNKAMPEEINRILTDHVSAILFCPTADSVINLKNEGITKNVIPCGDVMNDTLEMVRPFFKKVDYGNFVYVTLHRPYNTDDKERLLKIFTVLNALNKKIVFPLHPRTRKRAEAFDIDLTKFDNIDFVEPQSYIESLSYQNASDCVITDSGGIQKEAYILKKKCITVRSETEWTETLIGGWNTLVYEDLNEISAIINKEPEIAKHDAAIYGDGTASQKIAAAIHNFLGAD